MRVYLDTCSLNRLFDPAGEARVRLEAEAVVRILARIFEGTWTWIGSAVLDAEVNANPNRQVRAAIRAQMRWVAESMPLTDSEISRARELTLHGFKIMDSQHLACAEAGNVGIFLTTDDRLIRAARRPGAALQLSVCNPLQWMEEGAG